MNIEASNTKKNLEAAFAGESMANRKYLFFAKMARQLGDEEVAALFEKTANEETAHAFAHLELIYPSQELTVERLLELAIEGELYETNVMYPQFEQEAIAGNLNRRPGPILARIKHGIGADPQFGGEPIVVAVRVQFVRI